VTGVCSTANVDLVRTLGADLVIDYRSEDFTATDQTYTVIFDAAGKSSFSACEKLLTEGGIYLTTVVSPTILAQQFWTARFRGKKAAIVFAGLRSVEQKNQDLAFFLDLVSAGVLRPVIDRCYTFTDIANANRYVESGRKRGNVVVTVRKGD
jgi:NADPH:quinone reductase-like Zn-dependent oxidoreductase